MNIPQIPKIWPVTGHTNFIGKNSIFVAIKGNNEDGAHYIPLALQKGAKIIIAEHSADLTPEICQLITKAQAHLTFVSNARRTLATLSAKAWSYPAKKLKIIAITGTKGKTTTSWLLYHILQSTGHMVALLSTAANKIMHHTFETELTTQHPDYLHAFFQACINAGVEYVVMEVAAQAVSLFRVHGLEFDGLIFTNFAPSHGEFYADSEEYFNAKNNLFYQLKPNGISIINLDDQKGNFLLQKYSASLSMSVSIAKANFSAMMQESNTEGLLGKLYHKNNIIDFHCPALIGQFNLYNILAASSMALQLGITADHLQQAIINFKGVPGRLEKYRLPNNGTRIIDYAHNPLSFQSVLSLLRSLTNHLIVICGAGGERDATMRPLLGKIASEYADIIILTTDNPRSEDPHAIIYQIKHGVIPEFECKVICELDREEAIKKAYALSSSNTIIALLGKGPEQYQIIGASKIPFSERLIIESLSQGKQ